MSIDLTKLANLLTLVKTRRPAVAGYWEVVWDPDDATQTRYYSDAPYNEMSPYGGIGVNIKPRLLANVFMSTTFEIDPDIRTETVSIEFDDIDKTITEKFKLFKSGVICKLYFYWPDVNLTHMAWSGYLQAPTIYGRKTLQTVATNGYRSPELLLPRRNKRKECGRGVFGGKLPNDEARMSALCHYGLPGVGVNNPATGLPYIDCPGLSTSDCDARFGTTDGRLYGGFDTDSSATIIDNNTGFLAVSKGNASANKVSIRVIAGRVHAKGLQLIKWVRQPARDPKDGFVLTIWELGEGPIKSVSNFQINELITRQNNQTIRLGGRGQPSSGNFGAGTPLAPNFSHTAIMRADYGPVNVVNYSPSNLSAECDMEGFNEVCVYTAASPITKTRIWSDNRTWWILECYKNQKWGIGHAETEFALADWITSAAWHDLTVSTTMSFADGEAITYSSRRSTFNAIIEGRPAAQQIEEICRSGAVSVPFRHDGELTIANFRAATALELTNAKVFTDTGASRNITVADDNTPIITYSPVSDERVVNHVEVRFEEASNKGTERPISLFDDEQKLRAGRRLGLDYFLEVPKRFSAFGITSLAEATRFARRMLWFGEFDEGGIHNNGKVTITCDYEQTLGLKRYEIIKPISEILTGVSIGLGAYVETLEYARVLHIFKLENGRAQIVAQAYNRLAYAALEIEASGTSVSSRPAVVIGAGIEAIDGSYEYAGQNGSYPSYVVGSNELQRLTGRWRFYQEGVEVYRSSVASVSVFPWLDTYIAVAPDGISPGPRVYEGQPPDAGAVNITIGTPTYNATAGVLTVPIN